MLTQQQMDEIRAHLERAQNPLFFFDNDNDGLASFLLFRRFLDRGKGVPIKSFPDLNLSYYRKIQELRPDYIFILDKPAVSKEFLKKAKQDNIPVVWIDHHQVERPEDPEISYYNPVFNDGSYEPISFIAYKITGKKEDIWLAMIGCISDCYMPDFYHDFSLKFPDLTKKEPKSAFSLLYDSEIGRIARVLDFSLKDTTTNVVNMLRFMIKVTGPMDVLEENSKTKQILFRFNEIDSKYQELMEKARNLASKKLIYFQYGGSLSLSANLANQLIYEFPDKLIVVAYINGDIVNISIRGKRDVRKITLDAIKGIDSASGGGHENATGAKISV
jgi:hypothetical protein